MVRLLLNMLVILVGINILKVFSSVYLFLRIRVIKLLATYFGISLEHLNLRVTFLILKGYQ